MKFQKKKHRQLNTVLCGRCKLLSHGHMITAVGGNGGYPGGKQFITAEELREKLSHVRHEKALIVKLASSALKSAVSLLVNSIYSELFSVTHSLPRLCI